MTQQNTASRLYGYSLLREVELKCFEIKKNITTKTIRDSLVAPGDTYLNKLSLFKRVYKCLMKLEQLQVIEHRESLSPTKTKCFIYNLRTDEN